MTVDFTKMPDRNLTQRHKFSLYMANKSAADMMLPSDIPNIKKKHVPSILMQKMS